MYICNNCQEVFDDPAVASENHGLPGPGESFEYCPACGDSDFEETHSCLECGRIMPESQGMFKLCKKCEESAKNSFVIFMDTLSVYARKYLNWEYDGRDF